MRVRQRHSEQVVHQDLSKDHLQILDHIMYISTSTVARLRPMIRLTFEILAFLSYGMPAWKKSAMSQVHILLTISQIYTVGIVQTVRACEVSLVCLSSKVTESRPIIDGHEQQRL